MQREILNALPSWAIIVISVIISSIAISIMFVAVRHFLHTRTRPSETFLTTVIGVTSAIYGFFLGFVVVVLWQAFDTAQMVTLAEANYLALIVWDSAVFPEPSRNKLKTGVGNYINELIDKDWPAMREGKSSPEAFLELKNLFTAVQSFSPQNELESVYYKEIVTNINHVVAKRRERLRAMDSMLTDPLRFILVFGMFLLAFLLCLVETPNPVLQLSAILIVCGVIAFNLGIAVMLDYPFSGDVAVGYEPFLESILSQFQR